MRGCYRGKIAGEVARAILGGNAVLRTVGHDGYHPQTRMVLLSIATFESRNLTAIYRVFHEIAHYRQHERHPLLFAFREWKVVRYMFELDAWRQAGQMMIGFGYVQQLTPELCAERNRLLSTYWT